MTLGKALHLSEPQFPQSVQLVFLTRGRLAELQLFTDMCHLPTHQGNGVSNGSSSISL